MIDVALLDESPVTHGLHAAARRELAARAVLREYAPEEVLWRAGDPSRGLHLVLSGEVRVVRSRGGRQHVIHTEGAGGTLGEVPLFQGMDYPATAIATRRTRCLVLTRDAIHAAIAADPELAFTLLQHLSARVRALVDRVDRMAAQHVTARLAAFLLERSQGRDEPFTLGGTQASVAEEIGTVREVVVRALRELRERGVIGVAGRGRWRVLSQEQLQALARE